MLVSFGRGIECRPVHVCAIISAGETSAERELQRTEGLAVSTCERLSKGAYAQR